MMKEGKKENSNLINNNLINSYLDIDKGKGIVVGRRHSKKQ